MDTTIPKPPKKTIFFAVFFWLFNVGLLFIILFGFLPFFGIPIFLDALRGEVPISIILPTVGLIGVPTTSAVMGVQNQVKNIKAKQKVRLSLPEIFFGIEAPLLMICTIRLFFIRDLTPASGLIFATAAIGSVTFIHWLLTANTPQGKTHWVHLAGLTAMVMLTSYLSAIALFFAPPIIQGSFAMLTFAVFLSILSVILFPIATLFIGWVTMPFGMTYLFSKAWKKSFDSVANQYSFNGAIACVVLVASLLIGSVTALQYQPQGKAFRLLETPPKTDSDRQALLGQKEVIRKGLLNAYLSEYRYPSVENQTLYHLYDYWTNENLANSVQSLYSWVISPFAYRGDSGDTAKAESLYSQFFDTPIIRGEQPAVQKAVLSTFDRTEAKAGLIDINAERVQLEEQHITVQPQGDWADIEIHEVYSNKTIDETEVLYYFSLPESATITGLWLGETNDISQRYEYLVAPRGAAQQVYSDQVRRVVDPALLEQVGPRNYRLRAFPVPPVGQDRLPEDGQQDTMHLWLTYKVLKQDNSWPLPQLNEKRNIFWRNNTKRFLNGKRQNAFDSWLPESIPADSNPLTTQQAQLPSGYLIAQPLKAEDYQLPTQKKFAIILDTSYSMSERHQEIEQSMTWLKEKIANNNDLDLYLTKSDASTASKIDTFEDYSLKEETFFGWLQPHQIFEQFKAASAGSRYDAMVVITDGGSYELTEDGNKVEFDTPLWLLHLGGLKSAYDDSTLETIQSSGGNNADSIQEVMQRIATQPSLGEGSSLINVVDGYGWFLSQTPKTQSSDQNFSSFAARQWITQVSEAVKPGELKQLDAIHKIAKDNSIVTPYSSMIVLVNDVQKRELKEAEQKSDRFEREVEDQQLPTPQAQLPSPITAVPEPNEFLLILIGLILLGLLYSTPNLIKGLTEEAKSP